MAYGKKHVHNVETGEIELIDLTPEEVAQRDQERAAAEAEMAKPAPKSEVDQLKDLVDMLTKRVGELEKRKNP